MIEAYDQPDLAAARRQLEAAFAAYPARHPVPGCPCCVTAEDQRALAAGQIGRFAFKALTTWGEVEDFKHFLPRLFDHDAEQALDKLGYAEWRAWPQPEQRAVEEYLAALWAGRLAAGEEYILAVDLLQAIGELGIDLRPFLECWRLRAEADIGQLAALINDYAGSIYRLAEPPRSAAGQALLDWLLEPATARLLESAFFAAGGPAAAEISRAVEGLALLRDVVSRQ
ncbi:MAG TPA: hypothetical protein VD886_20545 [Herpetosiphonaceae bacterium]|nr:hypothetical protein [Herpetosiphonaceae bacterium]